MHQDTKSARLIVVCKRTLIISTFLCDKILVCNLLKNNITLDPDYYEFPFKLRYIHNVFLKNKTNSKLRAS